MLPSRAEDNLTKPPALVLKNHLLSYWPGLCKRIPKHYKLLLLPLISTPAPREVEAKSLLLKILSTSNTQHSGPTDGTDLKSPP